MNSTSALRAEPPFFISLLRVVADHENKGLLNYAHALADKMSHHRSQRSQCGFQALEVSPGADVLKPDGYVVQAATPTRRWEASPGSWVLTSDNPAIMSTPGGMAQ